MDYLNNKKYDINVNFKDGIPPLILSIVHKQDEIAKILIEKGTNVNIKYNIGFTALIHAIQREKFYVNIKITFNTDELYLKDFIPLTLNVDK